MKQTVIIKSLLIWSFSSLDRRATKNTSRVLLIHALSFPLFQCTQCDASSQHLEWLQNWDVTITEVLLKNSPLPPWGSRAVISTVIFLGWTMFVVNASLKRFCELLVIVSTFIPLTSFLWASKKVSIISWLMQVHAADMTLRMLWPLSTGLLCNWVQL